MTNKEAFEFGRDFQKISERYDFKDIAAYVNGEDNTSGEFAFYKLRPLFERYGYETTINAIKEATGKKPAAEIETRPDTEFASELIEKRSVEQ